MSGSYLCIPRNETVQLYYSPKQNYNVLSPNFHIQVYVSDECRNWERGRTVLFLGIQKSDIWCSALVKQSFQQRNSETCEFLTCCFKFMKGLLTLVKL